MEWGEGRKEGRGGGNETRSNICETMRWAVEAEEENFFYFVVSSSHSLGIPELSDEKRKKKFFLSISLLSLSFRVLPSLPFPPSLD